MAATVETVGLERGRMRAIVYRRFGGPEVLESTSVDRPSPGGDEVLVRIRAAAINPYDLHFLRGEPLIARPMMGAGVRKLAKTMVPGSDISGVVEAVGQRVTSFRPGEEVFGTVGRGGMAEFVASNASVLARKPANASFEQAAAVPMAATTALQALRDAGRLQPGQTVLVNGASGGIGTFAVQIAKALGAAEVTGVCRAANEALVLALGAKRTVDYTREDVTRRPESYDLLLDTAGGHSTRAFCRALKPGGTLVLVGGGSGRLLGPVKQIVGARLASPFVRPRIVTVLAHSSGEDVAFLAGLIEAGALVSAVDQVFDFDHAPDALRHLERGHPAGKVVVTI